MAGNRRDEERIQILGELPGDATVHQSISVKELSRTGAQIESTFPLQLNSLHDFRLSLGSQSVVVKGRVVALPHPRHRSGGGRLPCRHRVHRHAELGRHGAEQFLDAVKTGRQG